MKLALKLGYPNVDRMLREITWPQFLEWRMYDDLEPFGEERDDYRFASICQALWNIARDTKKYPNGFPLSDFLVAFGDTPRPEPETQSVAYQEQLIDAWVFTNNAILAAQEAR